MESKQLIINDKPNSFEFGRAGSRHKVYYNSVDELMLHIEKLKNIGLYKEDES